MAVLCLFEFDLAGNSRPHPVCPPHFVPALVASIATTLESMLEKIFAKHKVDEKVRVYLLSKNIVTFGQFAGLADDKTDVGEGICIPAVLDKQNWLVCAPVKSAWQEAEAYVQAELVQIKRGKFTDMDDPIEAEVRIKKTNHFNDRYHLRLAAHLVGCDSLAGRCVREHDRKTPTAQDTTKVKSLAHKPGDREKQGEPDGEDQPLNRYRFMYKHRVLMNTLALAVAPEWADADFSVYLDFHEWMVLKFQEKRGQLPPLAAVVDADFQMRTKWIGMMRNDQKTMTEAIKACRTEWVSFFSDLHESPDDMSGQEPSHKRGRRDLPRIDVDPNTGRDICGHFNKGKCTYGDRCKFAHTCNVKGCGFKHVASENHAVL